VVSNKQLTLVQAHSGGKPPTPHHEFCLNVIIIQWLENLSKTSYKVWKCMD